MTSGFFTSISFKLIWGSQLKFYLLPDEKGIVDRRVNFLQCHDTWKSSSIDLVPVSLDSWLVYVIIAVIACSINLNFLIWSLYDIYKWSHSGKQNWLTGPGNDFNDYFADDDHWLKVSLKSLSETRVKQNCSDEVPVDDELRDRIIKSKIDFWKTDKPIRCWWRFLLLASPMLTQVLDSVSDGMYFLNLKLKPRLVHVPAWVHVFQGILLFTCKLMNLSSF